MSPDVSASLVIWGDIDTSSIDEDAFNDWWADEHLPERLRLPGFKRARRYRTPLRENGTRNYLAWYEVSQVENLTSPEYMHALNNPTERTKRFMPCLARANRSACSIRYAAAPLLEPIANRLLLVEFNLHDGPLAESSCQQIASSISQVAAISNFTCLLHDEASTAAGSNSSSYQGVRLTSPRMDEPRSTKHIILVEIAQNDSTPLDMLSSMGKSLQQRVAVHGARDISWLSYELLCTKGSL